MKVYLKYRNILNMHGLNVVGKCPDTDLIEIVQLNEKKLNHPWFIGTQYHPEYRSRVLKPHPLFVSFVNKIKSIKNG